jgi:ketosteroid isomerase-like protein
LKGEAAGMNRRMIVLALAIAMATSSAAKAQTAASAMNVVNQVVAASEMLDASRLTGLYTDNAVFVDEGPIVIYGSTVGYDWLTRVKRKFTARHMTQFVASASRPTVVQVSGNGAYIVVPMELNAKVGAAKHFHESGLFTFTLARQVAAWKITSQVWTVLSESVK